MDSNWIQTSVDENNMNIYSGSPTLRPQEDGQFPAIIVAQAAGGVDEFIQNIVDRLSKEGYIALAPDLYHRTTPQKEQSTGKTRRQLLVDDEILYHCYFHKKSNKIIINEKQTYKRFVAIGGDD